MNGSVRGVPVVASLLFFAPNLLAASEQAASSPSDAHHLELVAEAGLAWPDGSDNVSTGFDLVGSALYALGKGCSLGFFVDWVRVPWTPEAGPSAHVDTVLYGPEFRATFNRRGTVLPHVYLGAGPLGIYPSRKSPTQSIEGSSGIRAGFGVDLRVLPPLRLGLSVGFVRSFYSSGGSGVLVPGDPGMPHGGWNIWALRISGRGEFL